MFLDDVIARDIANVETLLGSTKAQDGAGVRYDRTTISVLDLYMAQLQNESHGGSAAFSWGFSRA